MLRDATKSDFPTILALNAESVHFLSSLDEEQLALFADAASYLRVIEEGGEVAAFLLGFRKGDAYKGSNFAWFAERYDDFLYIDRVVVGSAYRGRDFAGRLYDDFEAAARARDIPWLTCEVDSEPPNPISLKFHARRGFRDVGSRVYGAKTVCMLARDLR